MKIQKKRKIENSESNGRGQEKPPTQLWTLALNKLLKLKDVMTTNSMNWKNGKR